jgi:hypothetical protein
MAKKLSFTEEINIARDFENNPEKYTFEEVDKLDCTNCYFNNCKLVCNQVDCVQITNEKGNFFIVKKINKK